MPHRAAITGEVKMKTLKVTFWAFSKVLNKGWEIVEEHESLDNAKLRASALFWQIKKVEEL